MPKQSISRRSAAQADQRRQIPASASP